MPSLKLVLPLNKLMMVVLLFYTLSEHVSGKIENNNDT